MSTAIRLVNTSIPSHNYSVCVREHSRFTFLATFKYSTVLLAMVMLYITSLENFQLITRGLYSLTNICAFPYSSNHQFTLFL